MPTITIANANLEWMNDWFTSDGDPAGWKPTFQRDGQTNHTDKTAKRAAAMVKAINADVLAIEEAPSRKEELDLFIKDYLQKDGSPIYRSFLSDTGTAQKLALLYKPGSVDSAHLAPHSDIVNLIDPWTADVDGDLQLEPDYRFTRNPLVVDLQVAGQKLQVIVMHTKSSFVNNGQSLWKDPASRQQYVVAALKARRRNATEGMRLRYYLEEVLRKEVSSRVIVLGDLNDGPGLDYFEKNYLAHNVTDIILGSAYQPEWVFAHAQHDLQAAQRYTAVFDDFVDNVKDKRMLLDHVLLSPGLLTNHGLRKVPHSGMVHHGEYNDHLVNGGKKREDRPSDHRPVSVRLAY